MIHKYTAQNGVRFVLETLPAVRSVTIGVWVLTGSRNETQKNKGISHFLEHMLFKGTPTRSAKQIAEAFDSIGGEINAFTSKEYTCYYAKVLDTHKYVALEILTDMFFHSSFDKEEIEKEKKVILEEINMDFETPDELIHDLLAEATYKSHPLGYPILGDKDTLLSFTTEDLQGYYHQQYIPENIVVSVAGNVEKSFIKSLESSFGNYSSEAKNNCLIQPEFHAGQLVKRKDTEQAHLCIGYKGVSIHDPDTYSLEVINNVIGGSMSSRLFQEIREERGLAYSVFSYHEPFIDSGLLTIYAGTGIDQLELLQETIMMTTKNLLETGLTEKELKNSKEQLKSSLVLDLESTSSRMSRNGKNELLLNRHKTLDELISEIEMVDEKSTSRVMEKVLGKPFSRAMISP